MRRKLAACGDCSGWKSSYDIEPGVTDQPEAQIYLSLAGKSHATKVYGLTAASGLSTPAFVGGPSAKPDELP